ncbi:UDP-glycosyltransferase 74F2-like [Mercurialis annua]|uniref:UDP-glycosyltransferase 74F2-like n=1 Tax=Mercurialis annua TaxID=3986 RepID=UPI00215FDBD5|nr:UDP-glycosyltransferase 74F2-like [Mercurialis annua]
MEKSSFKPHVLLLPYPGQGHINPMLHFARRLISKGIKTTLLTSIFIANSMNFGSSIGSVHLDVISDGYDVAGFERSGSSDEYLARLKTEGSRTLAELIEKYRSSSNRVDGIIYEPFLPWALDVAKEHGLFAAAFFTQPCAVDFIYYNIHHKLLNLPVDTWPVSISGLPVLESRDMPSFVGVPDSYPAYFRMLLDQFSNTEKADFILINTFYKLENEVVDEMSKVCPVLTIGPTVPSIYLDNRIQDDDDYGLDLFALNASISIKWITTKPPKSVVYVAFGSIATFTQTQMEELAWGLKNTNFYFLWVVRACDESKMPKKFLQELGDKGIVVNWSPQIQILASEAIGCFFTHSGWNSTIEALSLGVPMVAMPQWTDQPPNAKLVEDVWKVGIRVRVNEEGFVTREEVEGCIRVVMESEKGKEMRRNGVKWRELAIEAMSEGGTSDQNIDQFVSKLYELQ